MTKYYDIKMPKPIDNFIYQSLFNKWVIKTSLLIN